MGVINLSASLVGLRLVIISEKPMAALICQISLTEHRPISSTRKIIKLASIEKNTESVSVSPVSLTAGGATTHLVRDMILRYDHRLLQTMTQWPMSP